MKTRKVRCDIWEEQFFSDLTNVEQLVFLFLVSGPCCQLYPAFQCTDKTIKYYTQVDQEMLNQIKIKFEKAGRFYFSDGYVFLTEYTNWELNISPLVEKAYTKQFQELPTKIRELATRYCNDSVSIRYRYGIDTANDKDKGKDNGKEKEINKEKEKNHIATREILEATRRKLEFDGVLKRKGGTNA
jgi:hypothetical protein